MNQFVAILLIPFFVMGNSLADAHGIAAHPSQDQTRPHIHLGGGSNPDHHHAEDHHSHEHHAHGSHRHSHQGHSHQGHHHDQGLDPIPEQNGDGDNSDSKSIAPVEHDSDAVYLIAADSVFMTSARHTLQHSSQCFPVPGFPALGASVVFADQRPQRVFVRPLTCAAELPLYLLQAALRI